VLYSNDISQR